MRKLLFFNTKFRDTWFCIIYLKLDLLMKTLREGSTYENWIYLWKLCVYKWWVCLEISDDPGITWVLENTNALWNYHCFHQNSMRIDTALSNISLEKDHTETQSVSEVNSSILETNICWASAPAARESRFSKVNLPHSFLPGSGHSVIEIN